jgi:hypothetical protein
VVNTQRPPGASPQDVRKELARRLRSRAGEIEEAIFARVVSLSGQPSDDTVDYAKGVREAVTEALDYAVGAIEHGQNWHAPIPIAAIAQARRAARAGVSLDTVLRRYSAGDRELAIYVAEEADGLPFGIRQEIERTQSRPIDRLMEVVAEQYEDELARISQAPASGLQERMRRLLDGDTAVDLDPEYDIAGWHVAIVTNRADTERPIRSLAKTLDARLLFTEELGPRPYAWLGRRGGLDVARIQEQLQKQEGDALFAIGESRRGPVGWRLSHFEAQATFDAMRGGGPPVSRARNLVLVAAILREPLLAEGLLASYITPLDKEGGEVGAELRKTLRAYFSTGQQASAAAELLGVDRRTVRRRLQAIEDRLDQRIEVCHAQLQIALDVEEALRPDRAVPASV